MALQPNIQEDISNKELLNFLKEKFDQIDRRFNEHDQRFDLIDHRLDGHDQQFISINQRLDQHDQRFENIDKKFAQQTYDIISAFQGFANNTEERLQILENHAISTDIQLKNIINILDHINKNVADIKEDQISWKSNYQRYDAQLENHEVRILHLEHS